RIPYTQSGILQKYACTSKLNSRQVIQSTITEKSTPIVVYCASGARSASAKNNLIKLGYDNVSNGGAVASLALKLQKQIYRG
ncbi:rhodanese-like domain-containing protein, partial [Undibacterium jejuense]|uniref:rhodanese-like domain-containing protein n=1 Tax=Undibacterium jejuense TaxID=1344949 RepID=UPI00361D504D